MEAHRKLRLAGHSYPSVASTRNRLPITGQCKRGAPPPVGHVIRQAYCVLTSQLVLDAYEHRSL